MANTQIWGYIHYGHTKSANDIDMHDCDTFLSMINTIVISSFWTF